MRQCRTPLRERILELQAMNLSVVSFVVCSIVELRTPALAPRNAQVSQWIRGREEEVRRCVCSNLRANTVMMGKTYRNDLLGRHRRLAAGAVALGREVDSGPCCCADYVSLTLSCSAYCDQVILVFVDGSRCRALSLSDSFRAYRAFVCAGRRVGVDLW